MSSSWLLIARGNPTLMSAAFGLMVIAFVLSLASLGFRKPGGKLFSPVWRIKENYQPTGIALYALSVTAMVAGVALYLVARG